MVCKLITGFSSRPLFWISFVNLRLERETGTPVFQKTAAK